MKKYMVLSILFGFLLWLSVVNSVYAETIVHTNERSYEKTASKVTGTTSTNSAAKEDTSTATTTAEATTVTTKKEVQQDSNEQNMSKATRIANQNTSSNNIVPTPMKYADALIYQQKNKDDIASHLYTDKDIDGNKKKFRFFDFLKNEGLRNTGTSERADYTNLRLTVSYGPENSNGKPVAQIAWDADLAGNPNNGYVPHNIHIVFDSGYIRDIPLQGWQYQAQLRSGFLRSFWANNFWGQIILSDVDIYDISQHGNICAVYIDDGAGNARHFFYSGDKQVKEKANFTRGFQHITKMLDINIDTIKQKLADQQTRETATEKAKMKAEIQKELEREALKKEVLSEMATKQTQS